MRKLSKSVVAISLVTSMLFSMTSCVSSDAKDSGKDLIENFFDQKFKKVASYLDEDDKDYDAQYLFVTEGFEEFVGDADEVFEDGVEFKKEKVKVSDKKAAISYELEIQDEFYEYELTLVQDGKKWILEDNEDFIVNTMVLFVEVAIDNGDKEFKKAINDFMKEQDLDDIEEYAQWFYDLRIDQYKNGSNVIEVTEPLESEIVETEPDETDIDVSNVDIEDEYYEMSMFIAMPGSEIGYDNDIQNLIAEKTGVYIDETWLIGMTSSEAIGSIIASGALPDYIYSGDDMRMLYDAGCLVPWDDYLMKYPNLYSLYTPEEWDEFRQDDGHIYWADVFNNVSGEYMDTLHNEGAFWIQARVLEWAGYPEINTVEEYFDLLNRYAQANPTMPNGDEIIPFTTLCDSWRNFCLTNPPSLIAGYPNNNEVVVEEIDGKLTVVDFGVSEESKYYYGLLNEAYKNGILDPDFDTQTYDQYIVKLSTGGVLGMFDQYWDFGYTLAGPFKQTGLSDLGCDYVPLALVAEEGKSNRYHIYGEATNVFGGIAVTTGCYDPELAFEFMNTLLDQEIHDLRFWGIEGEDYLVDEAGYYYRTEEMRANWNDSNYKLYHACAYSYMPCWTGKSIDGLNAYQPSEQPSEYLATLPSPVANCFEAYGVSGYSEMLKSEMIKVEDWYPLYTFINYMTTATPGGVALYKIQAVKQDNLPNVVKADNFESAWDNYVTTYNACNPQDFVDEVQEELYRRLGY